MKREGENNTTHVMQQPEPNPIPKTPHKKCHKQKIKKPKRKRTQHM